MVIQVLINNHARYVDGKSIPSKAGINYWIEKDNTVSYTLNLKETSLKVLINEKEEYVVFDDIQTGQDIEYLFVVQLPDKNDSVSFVDYMILPLC